MYTSGGSFDIDNIDRGHMNKLADIFERYLDELMRVMIIPQDILEDCEDDINEAKRRVRKLIKKLRKGDTSVFKDSYDWNS